MNGTAKLVKVLKDEPTCTQALYELNPPIVEPSWDEDEPDKHHKLVVVSAIHNEHAHETFIFPGDENGITAWGELPGSFAGEMNHAKALEGAGYTKE